MSTTDDPKPLSSPEAFARLYAAIWRVVAELFRVTRLHRPAHRAGRKAIERAALRWELRMDVLRPREVDLSGIERAADPLGDVRRARIDAALRRYLES